MEEVFFYTVNEPSSGEYKEKGSKFLGFSHPVSSKEEVKIILSDYRKKYFDARHVCFAYVLGIEGDETRSYDDGEPNHSAGDPILGQIRSFDLTNVLIVVIRYFGGTKLGMGGLIGAYKTAAGESLRLAVKVREVPIIIVKHLFDYPDMNKVMGIVKTFDLKVIDQNLEITCTITLGVPIHLEQVVKNKLKSEYS